MTNILNQSNLPKYKRNKFGPDGKYPYRGLTSVRVTQLPEVPCPLQLHKRSPKEILENKSVNIAFMTGSTTVSKDIRIDVWVNELSMVEEEIQMKLLYLGLIDLLSHGFSMEECQMFYEIEKYRSSLAHLQIHLSIIIELKLQLVRLLIRSRREIHIESLNYYAN